MITVVAIAKDEAVNVPRFAKSLEGLYDKLVVCDTGSTDDTIKIARELGAEVHEILWDNDFASARNRAIALSGKPDWFVMIETDEVLRGSVRLREYLSFAPNKVSTIALQRTVGGDSMVPQLRAWRPGKAIWKYKRHSALYPLEGLSRIALDVFVDHPGLPDQKISHEESRRMLEQTLIEYPDDPVPLWQYAFELIGNKEYDLAVDYFGRFARHHKGDDDYARDRRATAMVYSGLARIKQGKLLDALQAFTAAIQASPQSRVGHVALAQHSPNKQVRGAEAKIALELKVDDLNAGDIGPLMLKYYQPIIDTWLTEMVRIS